MIPQLGGKTCHNEAFKNIQSLFPMAQIPIFSQNHDLSSMLQAVITKIPRPALADVTRTIGNMKTVTDRQEFRIQKNLLEIQELENQLEERKLSSSTGMNSDYEYKLSEESSLLGADWKWQEIKRQMEIVENQEDERAYLAFID